MEVESRYRIQEKIGEGAYGAVYKAYDTNQNRTIALKICKFQDCQQGVPSTCLRELSILKRANHPNLVNMFDAQIYQGIDPRLEMAFEYVDFDLRQFIKRSQSTGGVPEEQGRLILKQIIDGTVYLHEMGILHRDLKPNNILISKDLEVKIADFGLGRILNYPLRTMSKEIETLWYRSPELLLGTKRYDACVDVWSLGCIFYEIVEGKALFQSDSEIGQLFAIFQILGTPRKSEWQGVTKLSHFKPTFPKFNPAPPKFQKLSAEGQQFLWSLLEINPEDRQNLKSLSQDEYLLRKE